VVINSGRKSPARLLTLIAFHSTPFIINTFGPLSYFLAHGTVGAIVRRKLNLILVNQVEGKDEDDISK
jgi:hypothetical protein